jgi:hypothetical protein
MESVQRAWAQMELAQRESVVKAWVPMELAWMASVLKVQLAKAQLAEAPKA